VQFFFQVLAIKINEEGRILPRDIVEYLTFIKDSIQILGRSLCTL
jgi:hypothetical protein